MSGNELHQSSASPSRACPRTEAPRDWRSFRDQIVVCAVRHAQRMQELEGRRQESLLSPGIIRHCCGDVRSRSLIVASFQGNRNLRHSRCLLDGMLKCLPPDSIRKGEE
jgi:hypothetical protein